MKIVCSQSDLKNNLSLVSRVVPSRPEPAVLGNVLIEATEPTQKVSIVAFDGSLGIKTSFHAEVIESGSITLPAKLLNDIVTRLPEMEITLDVPDQEAFVVTISSVSGQFQLTGMDATEFPELPKIVAEQTIELPISALNAGLGGCLFAASTELSKQILTGVHLKTQSLGDSDTSDILEFAATDSHRLAVVAADLNSEESESQVNLPEFALTIPAKALRELEKIVSGASPTDKVKVSFDEQVINFELCDAHDKKSERLLTSTKIPGNYPAYGQLIPQNFTREIILDRKRLLNSLELVAVLAQKNNLVKFSLNNDQAELVVS
ncbi:MAG: DNA polymerase III subunit beta, partial [Waterburya sp.]